MKASVIIAHDTNRGDVSLERCTSRIKKSAKFSKSKVEIIVANEGSKVESRNNAAKKASGDIVVFIDDDAYPADSWFHELLKPFKDKKVAAVGGPNVVIPGSEYEEFVADLLLSSIIITGKSSSRYTPKGMVRETDESELSSCNLAVRKSVFLKVGGFPDVIPCEENALMNNIQKAGWKLIYTPLAVVHHNRPPLFMTYARKIFYYGKGRGALKRRKKGGIKFTNFRLRTGLYFAIGFVVHYVSYVSGLIWGWITG